MTDWKDDLVIELAKANKDEQAWQEQMTEGAQELLSKLPTEIASAVADINKRLPKRADKLVVESVDPLTVSYKQFVAAIKKSEHNSGLDVEVKIRHMGSEQTEHELWRIDSYGSAHGREYKVDKDSVKLATAQDVTQFLLTRLIKEPARAKTRASLHPRF